MTIGISTEELTRQIRMFVRLFDEKQPDCRSPQCSRLLGQAINWLTTIGHPGSKSWEHLQGNAEVRLRLIVIPAELSQLAYQAGIWVPLVEGIGARVAELVAWAIQGGVNRDFCPVHSPQRVMDCPECAIVAAVHMTEKSVREDFARYPCPCAAEEN